MVAVAEAKELICEMCRNFYTQGWVSGTGGGMSIKAGKFIVMAPSGVQKERMQSSDLFVLDEAGAVVESPQARPPPYKPPKLSECSPLFMAAYDLRTAGAVLHSHSMNAVLATMLQDYPGNDCVGEFRVTNLEMIKGIAGHGYFDECVVPIIENTAREAELTSSLKAAIAKYPNANAVLVKRHGVYVWGDTWIQAKTQAECYEYLFEAAVRLHQLGHDVSKRPSSESSGKRSKANGIGHAADGRLAKKARVAGPKPRAIVLDIEGTIAPISFVTNKLFPYARQHLKSHLTTTFESEETQSDITVLKSEARAAASAAAVAHGSHLSSVDTSDKPVVIDAVESYVTTLMMEDKKSTGLKALQGHIWRKGFEFGDLKAELYEDVLPALQSWDADLIKIYIYSSGSRDAQRNLLANTPNGDIRRYISGFFDTTSGPKVESKSYRNIAETIGSSTGSDILFVTDNEKEAFAADQAGWKAVLATRPGNATLSEAAKAKFRVINSLLILLS